MEAKTIADVCPELETEKGLVVYLDAAENRVWLHPDETHATHLTDLVEQKDNFNCIVISGSTGVTKENTAALSQRLQELGYDKKRIGLLLPHHDVLSDNFGFFVIPSLLNSSIEYFRSGAAAIVQPQIEELCRAGNIIPIHTAYLLVEPADQTTVGEVTKPDVIGRRDFEKALTYCQQVNEMGFNTISLEAGSGASEPVSEELVGIVRHNFGGTLTVGGGITTGQKVESLLRAGADVVSLGDVLEKSTAVQELIESLRAAVQRVNRK